MPARPGPTGWRKRAPRGIRLSTTLTALLALACSGGEQAPRTPVPVPGSLLDVDLSDEAVAGRSRAELWAIGVEHAGWSPQLPASRSKEAIHQALLDAKYEGAGDFGDSGYDE